MTAVTASDSSRSAPAVIEVEGLVHTFRGGVRALDGVDLTVAPGIVYGLLGPNGAGKTTLIRVLATLLVPDSGEVQVTGVDVIADPAAARTRIGLAGQFAAVDDYLTGRENVEMVGCLYGLTRREAHRRATEVLDDIGLSDDADRRVRTYSGGMRRRLDLAASLVGRPEVLFLDEPTTGIDPRNRALLWTIIERLVADGTTVLLTTQYLDEADRLADRIGVIDHGRIIRQGTAEQLKDGLDASVVELALATDDHDPARRAIAARFDLEPAIDTARSTLRIPAPGGTRTLIDALRALDGAGLEPERAELLRPTLDDVFLKLTGQPAEPQAGDDAASNGARVRRRRRRRP